MAEAERCQWRVGNGDYALERLIYAFFMYADENGDEQEHYWLIGMMDTPELARAAVNAHNAALNQEEN